MAPIMIGPYELGNVTLGEGKFGKVKSAVHAETGRRVAIKIIDKQRLQSSNDDQLVNEIRIMQAVNHKNVLQLIDVINDATKLYLIIELATNGDLFDKIIEKKRFSEGEARHFFSQIMLGLDHCHSKGIAHRDLKPENLLLGELEEIKICDFGLSNFWITEEGPRLLYTAVGTPHYAAPEIMLGRTPYNGTAIDIWSCGVILYVMTVGQFPFEEPTHRCKLFRSLEQGSFIWPVKVISSEMIDLLRRMMCVNVQHRITMDAIKIHSWMKGVFNPIISGHHYCDVIPMDMHMEEGLAARDVRTDGVMDSFGVHRINVIMSESEKIVDLPMEIPVELALERCTAFLKSVGVKASYTSDILSDLSDRIETLSFNRQDQPTVDAISVLKILKNDSIKLEVLNHGDIAGLMEATAAALPESISKSCIKTKETCDTNGCRNVFLSSIAAISLVGGSVLSIGAAKYKVKAEMSSSGGRVGVVVRVYAGADNKISLSIRRKRGDVLGYHEVFRSLSKILHF